VRNNVHNLWKKRKRKKKKNREVEKTKTRRGEKKTEKKI